MKALLFCCRIQEGGRQHCHGTGQLNSAKIVHTAKGQMWNSVRICIHLKALPPQASLGAHSRLKPGQETEKAFSGVGLEEEGNAGYGLHSLGRDRILTESVPISETQGQSFPKIKAGQDNTEYAPCQSSLNHCSWLTYCFKVSRLSIVLS